MAVLGEAEERRVPDTIEGVPPPGEHPHLFGHGGAWGSFRDAVASDRLHHAWLLGGPKGVGKATFALRAAASLLGSNGPDDDVARQIARGAHPGLLHIARGWDEKSKKFRTQLSVDDVRRTQRFFGMTAAGGDRRVCIVDAADEMSTGAANALLKVLEEPPAGAVFFVVAHLPGRLLPTIRSRCRALQFGALDDGEMHALVEALGPRPDAKLGAKAIAAAQGVPRQALLALQGDVLDLFGKFEAIAARALAGQFDWQGAHALAEKLSNRNAGGVFDQFHDLVGAWISARVRDADAADARSLARWAVLWERMHSSLDCGRTFNLDRKQIVLDLFAALFDAVAQAPRTARAS